VLLPKSKHLLLFRRKVLTLHGTVPSNVCYVAPRMQPDPAMPDPQTPAVNIYFIPLRDELASDSARAPAVADPDTLPISRYPATVVSGRIARGGWERNSPTAAPPAQINIVLATGSRS
jgi:hypothetical protein